MHGAGETALRRKGELLERHEFCGLVDAALDVVLLLELAELGRHQAEHDDLAFRHMAQWREITRALVVVLEKIAVDGEILEQRLGHRLVAAFRHPRALEVAATEVRADRHAFGAVGDRGIDELCVAARQLIGIVAALLGAFAQLRIAQVREVRIVELNVGAARFAERFELVPIARRDVGVERLEIGIRVLADRLTCRCTDSGKIFATPRGLPKPGSPSRRLRAAGR